MRIIFILVNQRVKKDIDVKGYQQMNQYLICVVLFQSMTVDGKDIILFAACQHSIFQSIFQLNHVCSIYFVNRIYSIESMQNNLLFSIIWLLIHARVSLFDHTVSTRNNKKHNIANDCQSTCLSCFVSIYDCLVKHAWVCLMMTVFPATQTCCLVSAQSITVESSMRLCVW